KGRASTMDLEILDIDEKAFREDRIDLKLYAYAKAIYIPFHIQSSKQLSPDTVDEVENQMGIARYIVETMDKNGIYILGPGTTVKRIADLLGIKKTLLGVDIYYKSIKVYNDVSEKEILNIIKNEDNVWIIVTPIGRQGILFGRGNQQISPEVIKRVGKDRIIVVATQRKLRDIADGVLRVDTQDPEVDNYLKGYIKVVIDYRMWRMVKIV
ncbi:MAG TPA: ATP-NAD kinase, partial [Thermoprotei archaeon]|nr:ATP-NAD kinase [Thermoprotei archaeon]